MRNNYPIYDEADARDDTLQQLAKEKRAVARRIRAIELLCVAFRLVLAVSAGFLIGWFCFA